MRYEFDSFTLDTDARQLSDGGAVVHLSGKALDLLRLLLEQRPRVLTKSELHDRLWPDTFVVDGSLPVLVREVRTALGPSRSAIRTVHRHGYAFSGEAREIRSAAAGDWASPLHQLMYAERVFPLVRGRNIVGRDPAAEVFIPSTSVSRRHVAITTENENAVVEDLSSKNGTRVDGVMITAPTPLRSGSIVRLGAIELRYLCILPNAETDTLSR